MKRTKEKAKLVFRRKLVLRSGNLQDGVIWHVPGDDRYPDKVKYRLVLVEPLSGNVIVLFDNHFPKGHHQHFKDGEELPYEFKSLEQLVDDYLAAIDHEEK